MKKKIITLLLICLSMMPLSGWAAWPVVDFGSIYQLKQNMQRLEDQTKLLKDTYDRAKKQLDTAQQQLDQAKQLKNDAEGHYGFGGLMNDSKALKNRSWSPDHWQNALKGVSGGNPERYQALLKIYKENYPAMKQDDYQKGSSVAQYKVYEKDIQVNRAAMINATYAFNTIKKHLQTIHTLSQEIDKAKNIKAAMDLNSRLLTEVAYIQTQSLKMQVLVNQQMAQANADMIAGKTARARFNRLPDE